MKRLVLEVTDTVTGITTFEGATVIESAEQLEAMFASFGIETDDAPDDIEAWADAELSRLEANGTALRVYGEDSETAHYACVA